MWYWHQIPGHCFLFYVYPRLTHHAIRCQSYSDAQAVETHSPTTHFLTTASNLTPTHCNTLASHAHASDMKPVLTPRHQNAFSSNAQLITRPLDVKPGRLTPQSGNTLSSRARSNTKPDLADLTGTYSLDICPTYHVRCQTWPPA